MAHVVSRLSRPRAPDRGLAPPLAPIGHPVNDIGVCVEQIHWLVLSRASPSDGVIVSTSRNNLGLAGYLGDRHVPPSAPDASAESRIGCDDNDRGAPGGAHFRQGALELGEACYLVCLSAEARRMCSEIDAGAARKQIVERGATASAL